MPDITKLPKWAQDHCNELERQRDAAVRAYNRILDDQTESPFRVVDLVCTGEDTGPTLKTRYIQAHRMMGSHCGMELTIILRSGQIDLSWSAEEGLTGGRVAMVPSSYMAIRLINYGETNNGK